MLMWPSNSLQPLWGNLETERNGNRVNFSNEEQYNKEERITEYVFINMHISKYKLVTVNISYENLI